jgi:hypothetical protein
MDEMEAKHEIERIASDDELVREIAQASLKNQLTE